MRPRVGTPIAGFMVGLGVAAFVAIRSRLFLDDFPNPDIAGIVYNADLIVRGGLPYLDTVEVKAPGSFFLVAGVFTILGRSLEGLQVVHSVWLALGAGAVFTAARGLYGRDEEGRVAAAVATAVYLLYAGMFTYNYSSWMMPIYAWGFAAGVRSLRGPSRGWSWMAGAAAVGAILFKRQAVVIVVVLPLVWRWARRRGWTGANVQTLVGWVAGGLVGLVVVATPYAVAGALSELLSGLVPWSVAAEYAAGPGHPTGWLGLLGRVGTQLVEVLPVGAALGACAVAGWISDREAPSVEGLAPALGFLFVSVLGAGIGGARFYLHYLVQYVPALALVAGHPAGLGLLRRAWGPRPWPGRVAALVVMGSVGLELVAVARGTGHRYEAMARRLEDGRTAAQAAGAHIQARTRPGESIYGWGWTAWPVYYWADRPSPTRVYKSLGTLTTFNTNTAFSEGTPIEFRPGPEADLLVDAFRARRPAYFVYSSSYLDTFGCEVDPLRAWTELGLVLQQGYRAEAQYGDLVLFGRR